MTAKEKAKELVSKYEFIYIQNYTSMYDVKRCAIISVNEIIDLFENESLMPHLMNEMNILYWEEVIKEIELI